jgi:hypothetical protein
MAENTFVSDGISGKLIGIKTRIVINPDVMATIASIPVLTDVITT